MLGRVSLSSIRRRWRPLAGAAVAVAGALALVGCGGGDDAEATPAAAEGTTALGTVGSIRAALRTPGVQTLGYRVVREQEHDTSAFTQGLALRGGVLYEGTGLYGESRIERRTFPGGRVTAERRLPALAPRVRRGRPRYPPGRARNKPRPWPARPAPAG